MSEKLLSKKFYDAMKKLEPRFPTKVALMLPALHAAQDEYNWLPPEVLDEIAEYIECHPAQVREVASFYTMYHLKPVGKHTLKICTNTACTLRGADEVMDHCLKRLEIKKGETTPDRLLTIEEEECLGACGTAPALMKDNHEYIENLTIDKVDKLITRLQEEAGKA